MDKNSNTNALALSNLSDYSDKRTIDPVSKKLIHALTPGQQVTGWGVPLTSFENEVIDDLQRDLFWSVYLANSNLKEECPEGRESVRDLLTWVLSDPTYKVRSGSFVNRKVSAAVNAYVTVEQLMNMEQIQDGLSQMGDAEDKENQADELEKQADSMGSGGDSDENSDGENSDSENSDSNSDGDSGDNSDNEQDDNGDSGNDDSSDDGSDDGSGSGSGDSSDDEDGDWDPDDFEDDPDNDWDDSGDDEAKEQELRDAADQLRKMAQELREEAEQDIAEAIAGEMSDFGKSGAIKMGADTGEQVMAFLSSWGIEEGKDLKLDPQTILDLMKTFSAEGMASLTTMIGRIHGIAKDTIRGRAPLEVVVETAGFTKDILAIAPGERYKLTEGYPYRNQAIEQWLTRGLGGITKTMQAANEGAFICAIDESSSMKMYTGDVRRIDIAKALALGIARTARENAQDYALFGFSSGGRFTETIKPGYEITKLLEWSGSMLSGGTDLDGALNKMLDSIEEMEEDDRFKADLVFITDGESTIYDGTIDRFYEFVEAYGVRLFTLLIGTRPEAEIMNISDRVVEFTSLDKIAQELSEFVWD